MAKAPGPMKAKNPPSTSAGAVVSSSALADYPMKPSMPHEIDAELRRQKAQDALHTLSRAEEHKRDKGLMRDVKKLAKEKVGHLTSIFK